MLHRLWVLHCPLSERSERLLLVCKFWSACRSTAVSVSFSLSLEAELVSCSLHASTAGFSMFDLNAQYEVKMATAANEDDRTAKRQRAECKNRAQQIKEASETTAMSTETLREGIDVLRSRVRSLQRTMNAVTRRYAGHFSVSSVQSCAKLSICENMMASLKLNLNTDSR